jgi:hypothetical protein
MRKAQHPVKKDHVAALTTPAAATGVKLEM